MVFLEAPSGVVYYPPTGHLGKAVVCRTNEAADITWVSTLHGSLDATTFNITRVSDTKSVMYLTVEFIHLNPIIGGTLTTGSLHCFANGVKSSTFKIQEGSKERDFVCTLCGL